MARALRRRTLPGSVLVAALLLGGCVTFSTFQGPEPVERGEVELGVGALAWAGQDEGGLAETAVTARYGVADGADLGLRIFGIPPFWGGVYADAKYQLTERPTVSGVLGASWFDVDGGDTVWGLYPMLMAGTGRFHGGLRYVRVTGAVSLSDTTSDFDTGIPGFMVGGAFGSRVRMMPEVNVYFGDDVVVFPGVGVQVRR